MDSVEGIGNAELAEFQIVTWGMQMLAADCQRQSAFIGTQTQFESELIGDNCRIGANAVVVTDMPSNTTAVAASTRFIHHDEPLNNEFSPFI